MEVLKLLFQTGWILVAILWAYIHYRKIEYKKLKPGSVGDYFLRIWFGCVFAGASLITISSGDPFTYNGLGYKSLLVIGGDLVSEAGIFWLVFDLALNLMRPGKAWNYISTTNGKLADEIFKGNWKLQYAAKLGIILIGELVYYLS